MARGSEVIEQLYVDIGERVRQARKRAGLSLKDVGALMDPPLEQSTLSAYENGVVRVRVDQLLQFASLLDVHVLDLLPGAEPRASDALEAQNQKLRASIIGALKELQKGA